MGIREKLGWTLVCALLLTAAAAFAGVISAGPLDPPGALGPTDGVREPGTPITSLPFTASTSGRYYLTRNLTSVGAGITVTANDVDIDLGGFAIVGPGSSNGAAISATRAHIHDGFIRSWQEGVSSLSAANSVTVERVQISSTTSYGIRIAGSGVARDCSVTDGGTRGVAIFGTALVERCRVMGVSNVGINVGNGSVVTDCTVNDAGFGLSLGFGSVLNRCVITNAVSTGVAGNPSQIRDVVVSGGGFGIAITGDSAVIVGCSIRGGTGAGISIASNALVDSCVVENNGGIGISVQSFSIVRNSVAGVNTGGGIVAGPGSLVEGNTSADNVGDGIRVSTGSRVLNNTIRFNQNAATGAGVHVTGEGNWVEGNDLSSNDIGVLSDVGNNTIINNSARNHGSGNFVLQADDLAGVLITDANDGTNTSPHYNNTP